MNACTAITSNPCKARRASRIPSCIYRQKHLRKRRFRSEPPYARLALQRTTRFIYFAQKVRYILRRILINSRAPAPFRARATPLCQPENRMSILAGWKCRLVMLALCTASVAAHADQLAKVKQAGELVVGTEMQFAPFDFLENGQQAGFNKDLFAEVGKELGVKVRFIDLPWPSVLPGPRSRQVRHGRRTADRDEGAHGSLYVHIAHRRRHRRAAQARQRSRR
jgi:hypothetical protein